MMGLTELIEMARAEHNHAKGWAIQELNDNAIRIVFYPYGIRYKGISIAFTGYLNEPLTVEAACSFIEDRLNKENVEQQKFIEADRNFFSPGSRETVYTTRHANI